MKILTVIGARPQIIKAAALSRAIRTIYSGKIKEVIVHTGQHYDGNMSQVFFDELEIPAEDYNLNIGSGSHAQQTAGIMLKLEEIIIKEAPDAIVLYGDTNSTIAGSITANKLSVPIIHIEAGMRSFNKKMPEEINRICTDYFSTLLFSPTKTGIKNLINEGFKQDNAPPYSVENPKVYHCGDVMFDNSLYFEKLAKQKSQVLALQNLKANNFVLVTVHRDSNTDIKENINNLFSSFHDISSEEKIDFIIPLHPRTKKMLQTQLEKKLFDAIQSNTYLKLIEPVSFLDMIQLEANCRLIMTDSGGVQKESYFFKKPCIILRNETEWLELVEQGTALICGSSCEKIKSAYNYFKNKNNLSFPGIFGDGKAAEFICSEILAQLKSKL